MFVYQPTLDFDFWTIYYANVKSVVHMTMHLNLSTPFIMILAEKGGGGGGKKKKGSGMQTISATHRVNNTKQSQTLAGHLFGNKNHRKRFNRYFELSLLYI